MAGTCSPLHPAALLTNSAASNSIRTLTQLRSADTPTLASWILALAGDAAANSLREDHWDGAGFVRLLFSPASGLGGASLKAGCEEMLERKLRWRPGMAYKVAAHLETLVGVQAGPSVEDHAALQSPPIPHAGILHSPSMLLPSHARSAMVKPVTLGAAGDSSATYSDESSSSSSSSSRSFSSSSESVRAPKKPVAVKPHPTTVQPGSHPKKAAAPLKAAASTPSNKPSASPALARNTTPAPGSSTTPLSSPPARANKAAARPAEPAPAFKSVRVQPLPSSAPAVGGGVLTLPKSGYVRFDEEGNRTCRLHADVAKAHLLSQLSTLTALMRNLLQST
jgi:hypothetical protein